MSDELEKDHQSFVDWRGNTIHVGDTIVYPRTSGRSAVLTVGVVRRIYEKPGDYNPKRLDVEVVDKAWDWRRTDEQKASRPLSRLKYWDRCLLLEKASNE